MQAVLETIKWPEEIVKPSFMTALSNGKLKEKVNQIEDMTMNSGRRFMLMTLFYSLKSVLILS
jgi:hypothetical protein